MKHWNWRVFLGVVLIALVGVGLIPGCESGEKEYRKIEKDMEKLESQQTERYESILGVEEEDQGQE